MTKSLMIAAGVSVCALILELLFVNAHDAKLDELGCHRDPPGAHYHCHVGALKGREFENKDQAEQALAAASDKAEGESDFSVTYEEEPSADRPKDRDTASDSKLPPLPDTPKLVINPELLKVVSWSVKRPGRPDYDRIVNVLAESDIAALDGLDLDEKGKGPLHIIGDLLQGRIHEKVCRMWFMNKNQGREHIGILWRNSTVSYVTPQGEVRSSCGDMAVVVPTNKAPGHRAVASATFYSKTQKKTFQFGTVNLDSKAAQREVVGLFRHLEQSKFPTIVVGDLKVSTAGIKRWSFKNAIAKSTITSKKGVVKTATANIWSRNAVVVRGLHVNLYDRFSELSAKDIDARVSEGFPTLAEVALVAEPTDKVNAMIAKSKRLSEQIEFENAGASRVKPQVNVQATGENFDEPTEDLEAEANMADGDERAPSAAKGGSKRKKKKKRRN